MAHRPLCWDNPAREDGESQSLHAPPNIGDPTLELMLCTLDGVWNNCDVYLAADDRWMLGLVPGTVPLFNLYTVIGGQLFLVAQTPASTTPFRQLSGGFSTRLFGVRGRPGEGFRVSVQIHAPVVPLNPLLNDYGQGRAYMIAWGEETAPDSVALAPGGAVNATIVAPIPLPVVDAPSSTIFEQNGTAPDNTVAPFAPLAAAAPTRYLEVSADSANAGTLYVAAAALAVGNSNQAAYELAAGDSVRIEIDDATKVFVGGSAAGQNYRVAIV